MSYEYDSKLNRDLARTAMDIFNKSHNIVKETTEEPVEETTELNEETKDNMHGIVSGLIIEFISNAIITLEQTENRECAENEIQEISEQILGNIDALSVEEKSQFIAELASDYEGRLLNESE